MGERHEAVQCGHQRAKPSGAIPIRAGTVGSGESDFRLINSNLNALAINVRGIMCHGRSEQVRLLMIKHKILIAILSEKETTHAYAATTKRRVSGLSALPQLLVDPLVRKLESS